MDRRNFIQSLGAIPVLGTLLPQAIVPSPVVKPSRKFRPGQLVFWLAPGGEKFPCFIANKCDRETEREIARSTVIIRLQDTAVPHLPNLS